jgi:hypothetical protein
LHVSRLYVGISLSALFIFAPLLVFHAASMRYLMDFVPSLMLLSIVSYWTILDQLIHRRILFIMLFVVISILSLYGGITGLLLAMTGHSARLESLNPEVFMQLSRFFTPG